jgi:DNA-binding transcriptional LysR family regulator
MDKTLDLSSIRSFICVVETGSFTRTARVVGRTQSAITMQIKRLEQLLGGAVFERSGGVLRLSPRGERFLPMARELMRDNDAILQQLRSADLTGRVRLGVCDDFAEGLLAGVLSRFRQTHTQVDLEVTIDLSVPVLDRFDAGLLDLAVAKRFPSGPEPPLHVLTRAEIAWITAADAPHQIELPLRLVLFPERAFPRDIVLAALRRANIPWVPAATCHSLAALRAAVAAGLGITAIASNAAFGGVKVLHAPELPVLPCAETALFWRPGALTPAVERLRRAIVEATPTFTVAGDRFLPLAAE